jgi:hypothetical protein
LADKDVTIPQLALQMDLLCSIGVLELEEEMAQVRKFYQKAGVPRY